MSRIGKKPIVLPSGVSAEIIGNKITIKGPKGTLDLVIHPQVQVVIEGTTITVSISNTDDKKQGALWGLFASLIINMIEGVTKGFEKKLEMNGIGFKAEVKNKILNLEVGFSHTATFAFPVGIEVTIEKNIITVKGIDCQLVGSVAAQIRDIRPPEPYKGSGIKYSDEKIRRKAGKAAVKSGG